MLHTKWHGNRDSAQWVGNVFFLNSNYEIAIPTKVEQNIFPIALLEKEVEFKEASVSEQTKERDTRLFDFLASQSWISTPFFESLFPYFYMPYFTS